MVTENTNPNHENHKMSSGVRSGSVHKHHQIQFITNVEDHIKAVHKYCETAKNNHGYNHPVHYSDVIQWRHNGRDGVSNHRRLNCLLKCSGAEQRKHQSSVSLAFVRGSHRWPVNCPHKWPVTRKMFPFDDVIMISYACIQLNCWSVNTALSQFTLPMEILSHNRETFFKPCNWASE